MRLSVTLTTVEECDAMEEKLLKQLRAVRYYREGLRAVGNDACAHRVLNAACIVFEVAKPTLTAKGRAAGDAVRAKHTSMFYIREMNGSVSRTAVYFNTDHSEVLWACKSIQNLIEQDAKLKAKFDEVGRLVRG